MKTMTTLWIQSLKLKRWSIAAYSLVSFGFIQMYLSVFSSIQSQAQNLSKLLESYPKAFMKAFDVSATSFSTLGGYLSVEAYGVIWQIIVILLVVSFAGNALAGEVENGTLAITLSMPISRAKVYASRYLAGATALATFVVASVLLLIPIVALRHDSIASLNVVKLAFSGWLWGAALFSFTYMISALFEEKSKVYIVAGGTLLGMYALNLFSGLLPRLDKFKYASVFHYYNASQALVNGRLDGLSMVVLSLTVVVSFVIGLLIIKQRDISI